MRQVPTPTPPRGWARIRVIQAGICGTDLALTRGLYGFIGIPGHEFIGTVTHGPRKWLGRRVVTDINVACGRCQECRQGNRKHCRCRKVLGIRGLNGAFAEDLIAPVKNLEAVPEGLDDDGAVFAEPLAAALDARNQLSTEDSPVLVVGPGRLGQLVARVLLKEGFRVSCLGRSQKSLSRLPPGIDSAQGFPESWTGRFAAVVECSGTRVGIGHALAATRPRGTLVLKGTAQGDVPVDFSRAVVDELRVVGSRCGDISIALKWLSAGRVDPRDLITGARPLHHARSALLAAARPEHVKLLLRP